jgi:hypothetical protein
MNDKGFIFSYTADMTQTQISMNREVPNPLYWWNRSFTEMIPDKIPSIFKLKLVNVNKKT